jgi:hypothetical protein
MGIRRQRQGGYCDPALPHPVMTGLDDDLVVCQQRRKVGLDVVEHDQRR